MLYGANGYTGELTARLAKDRGLSPVLAGRSEAKIRALAQDLGFEYRIFDLDNVREVERGLEGMSAVLHHAGPFSSTSRPMMDACLATGTHYLDITGEIAVFEAIHRRHGAAEDAGIVVMPGVGFDVVPTDCVAAYLSRELPDATHLELAFATSGGQPSRGTTKTMIEGLGLGGAARIGGEIQKVPTAWRTREVTFPSKVRSTVSIPWGDVSTAFHTTGIPNITVYMSVPPKWIPWMQKMDMLGGVLRQNAIQSMLKKVVERKVYGPDEAALQTGYSEVFGEVWNDDGDRISLTIRTPDGYALTADSSLCAVQRVLKGDVRPGVWTPAGAFGPDYVAELQGVTVFDIVSY